ncbi:hypothetical protein IAR55_006133 [Kwoniella newhampshirensis]|uniref:Uncharacterized protein n=1 Tax=Kwoniella newhampshirensis TaxID=1651941 RepID=A0AAW0YUR9_9TREE
MTNFKPQPLRSLSPITELTTPNSLRALTLPQDDSDYHSEHAPEEDHNDDGASVCFHGFEGTITQGPSQGPGALSRPLFPYCRQQRESFPSPSLPPRSPYRPRPSPLHSRSSSHHYTTPEDRYTTFPPRPTPLPGGLLPPPRTIVPKPKPPRRPAPPPSPLQQESTNGEATGRPPLNRLPSHTEDIDEGQDAFGDRISQGRGLSANLAGVSPGRRPPPDIIKSRPNSFHAGSITVGSHVNRPAPQSASDTNLPESGRYQYPILHDVPLVTFSKGSVSSSDRQFSGKSSSGTYDWSRISPHSSQSRPTKSRPVSFHGSPRNITPGSEANPARSDMQLQAASTSTMNGLSAVIYDSSRPTLVSRHLHSPGSVQSSSGRSSPPSRKDTTRRRRVSSILFSIFGTDSGRDSSNTHKSSRRSRYTNGFSSMVSLNSPPSSPITGDNAGSEEGTASVQIATRSSGTFGIPDDGSDIFGAQGFGLCSGSDRLPGTTDSRFALDRTQSADGSVLTHSEGVRRILYVENLVETPKDGGGNSSRTESHANFTSPASPATERPYASMWEGKPEVTTETTPDHIESVRPTSNVEIHSNIAPAEPHQQQQPPAQDSARTTLRLNALTLNAGSRRASIASDISGGSLFFPSERTTSSGGLPDRAYSSATHLPLSDIPENQPIHSNGNMPDHTSSNTIPRSRPLPRPTPRQVSPIPHPPQATFIPTLPPGQTPGWDLPLLIASHLLSTHAAALIGHSTAIREVSDTMQKMAKESLDWGGTLMGMAGNASSSSRASLPDGLPRSTERPSPTIYEGVPHPNVSFYKQAHAATHSTPTTGRQGEAYDPVQAAYDNLTAVPPRPSAVRSGSKGESRRNKGESLPTDLLEEAEKLGQQEWSSLHVAEAAWTSAMRQLGEIVKDENRGDVNGRMDTDREHVERDDSEHGPGVASTRLRTGSERSYHPYDERSTLSALSAVAQAFPSAFNSHQSVIPGLTSPYRLEHMTAFLPSLDDMIHFPAQQGSSPDHNDPASHEINATIRLRPKAVHAFSNPLIQPVDNGPTTRPVSQIPEQGYTESQLGSAIVNPSERGNGSSLSSSTSTRGEKSTMGVGTRRKLRKKTTVKHSRSTSRAGQPREYGKGGGSVSRIGFDEGGLGVGCVGTGTVGRKGSIKPHWWSRKRSEVD